MRYKRYSNGLKSVFKVSDCDTAGECPVLMGEEATRTNMQVARKRSNPLICTKDSLYNTTIASLKMNEWVLSRKRQIINHISQVLSVDSLGSASILLLYKVTRYRLRANDWY